MLRVSLLVARLLRWPDVLYLYGIYFILILILLQITLFCENLHDMCTKKMSQQKLSLVPSPYVQIVLNKSNTLL